jgi:endogenous inhibitor of DNA gyrase (YacG/DUF329 family)
VIFLQRDDTAAITTTPRHHQLESRHHRSLPQPFFISTHSSISVLIYPVTFKLHSLTQTKQPILVFTMSSIDLFGDFCLTCDRQTNNTPFCSQSCRLAELDRYTNSEPSSPSYHTGSTSSSSGHRQSASGFYLPPAYDFRAHRSNSSTSLSTSTSSTSTKRSSSTSTSKLTEQARSDLRDYVGSFDQTRTLKRRVSMQSN